MIFLPYFGYRSSHVCLSGGAPVAQWVKRWPTDVADKFDPH